MIAPHSHPHILEKLKHHSHSDLFPAVFRNSCNTRLHFKAESLAENCKAARLSRNSFHAEPNRAQETITAFPNSAKRLDCNGLENRVLRKGRVLATLAVLSFSGNCRFITGGQAWVANDESVCACEVPCYNTTSARWEQRHAIGAFSVSFYCRSGGERVCSSCWGR